MNFSKRHIGPRQNDSSKMCQKIGVNSVDQLIHETVPKSILQPLPFQTEGLSETDYLSQLKTTVSQNKVMKSLIGLGYYNTITPPVIQRNILENPGWYTQYTPYQAEISQGRLEALLNFQTMICDLTQMDIANASLLDESTAAAEAMTMLYRSRPKEKKEAHTFVVSNTTFPQTIDVLKSRAKALDIQINCVDINEICLTDDCFAVLLQYPDCNGEINNYKEFIQSAHTKNITVSFCADLLSLVLITPPGAWNADVVVGSTQRFGVPLGFGGPHAAYFATKEAFSRKIPGRIIGQSVDKFNNPALRMALQTREQHIRRDKATSNICTAQALLAIMAGFYAVYHGPEGLTQIATTIHQRTTQLAEGLKSLGFNIKTKQFFDTIILACNNSETLHQKMHENGYNLREIDKTTCGVSIDETTSNEDIAILLKLFAETTNKPCPTLSTPKSSLTDKRQLPILLHPIFNTYHSESQLLRYMKKLENKDLSLTKSMIPLGSCTMKLNATAQMIPLSWPELSTMHPFAPKEQTKGYLQMIQELDQKLCQVTGFDAFSFQPNSGAQGEFAGLLTIQRYFEATNQSHRNIALIPLSAHGTNPASAAMAGMTIVGIKCTDNGNIDMEDFKAKCEKHKENLACLMVTYPSTYGVFEETIQEVCQITHNNGGMVYMDGANMNAQVGLTNPAIIGADVCHLNLHKTFAIPHGGGGPGMGPIGVTKTLAPYLPGHIFSDNTSSAIASAPYSSASILTISHAYIHLLGSEGLTNATKIAILNANYIKARLENHYPILFKGINGHVAHELIVDLRHFKKEAKIDAEDVAKRLMDYGFHAPTLSWPVAGTIMIEPTESEDLAELDRFCEAMIEIRKEIQELIDTEQFEDNLLKNAPHTQEEATADVWKHHYLREKAVYPLPYVKEDKFWPRVSRINQTQGDRNLICSCAPVESFIN